MIEEDNGTGATTLHSWIIIEQSKLKETSNNKDREILEDLGAAGSCF